MRFKERLERIQAKMKPDTQEENSEQRVAEIRTYLEALRERARKGETKIEAPYAARK